MEALHVSLSLAASKQWPIKIFDVKSAFLTGKETTREVCVRPPRCGLPGVPQGALIKLTKGCFGLQEAPRLWWEKLKQTFLDADWHVVKSVPGVFALYDRHNVFCGLAICHADDVLWTGAGVDFDAGCDRVRARLDLKSEVTAGKDGAPFLGRVIKVVDDGHVVVDQTAYVREIKSIPLPMCLRRVPELLADTDAFRLQGFSPGTYLTLYRSLVQQMAWPARSTTPTVAYEVSALQQPTKDLKVKDNMRANALLKTMQAMAEDGQITLCFRRPPMRPLQEPGGRGRPRRQLRQRKGPRQPARLLPLAWRRQHVQGGFPRSPHRVVLRQDPPSGEIHTRR